MNEERLFEIFDLNAVIADFPPDPETKAKHRAEILVKSDTLRVVVVTALTDGMLHEQNAPGPTTIQVLEGSFTVTIGGQPRLMKAGEIAIVPPTVTHGMVCEQDGAFLLTIAHLSHTPDPGGDNTP